MSYVFLAGDFVYKLKKPVRYAYLDFSTLARRKQACEFEVELNRRLAPDVYLGVCALVATARGPRIGGDGDVLDWLVAMRRLEESRTLERAIQDGRVVMADLDRVAATLRMFYQHAKCVHVSGAVYLQSWRRSLLENRRLLLAPALGLPRGLVHNVCRVQARFMREARDTLARRAGMIVDAHGDLRPEHIWLTEPVRIIDCLEFNAQLRAVDPLDEVAFLCLECERLGSLEASNRFQRKLSAPRPGAPDWAVYRFYRCHRATLRARLAIAHLLEPNPRSPEKWPRLARDYLLIAHRDARALERCLDGRRSCDMSTRTDWSR